MHDHYLTPVELHDGIYYKRDDHYCKDGIWYQGNFGSQVHLSGIFRGGKVRQAFFFAGFVCGIVQNNHNSTIIMQSQVNTTSGAIMAEVAKVFGLKCVICVGATTEDKLKDHPMMALALYFGADVRIVSGVGYANAINSKIRDIIKKERFFDGSYCVENACKYPGPFLDIPMMQVENIPDELDNLVVPVGSGVHLAAIMKGVKYYNKKVKRIIGVRVGPDRKEDIDKLINPLWEDTADYELLPYSDKMSYSRPCHQEINGEVIDPFYEAKALLWTKNNISSKEKTCFWVVGRHPTKEEVQEFIRP
jgi:1-aminocyclopropane-1-carboxylate deaminase/D-cysteine desulfhydrase-like pyridoxal-dependent ACC family enzyme